MEAACLHGWVAEMSEMLVSPGKQHDCISLATLQLHIDTALCPLPSSGRLQNICCPPSLCIPLVTVRTDRLEVGVCVCWGTTSAIPYHNYTIWVLSEFVLPDVLAFTSTLSSVVATSTD